VYGTLVESGRRRVKPRRGCHLPIPYLPSGMRVRWLMVPVNLVHFDLSSLRLRLPLGFGVLQKSRRNL